MRFLMRATIFAALLCFGLLAQFQAMSALPDVPGVEPTFTAGSWVEYLVKGDDGKSQKIKFSILSEEKVEGKALYWFELKSTDEDGDWSIMKFKSSNPKDKDAAVSLIMQKKGEPAHQMDFMLPANRPTPTGTVVEEPDAEDETPDFNLQTEENVFVEVPAGKFKTTKLWFDDEEEGKTEMWISEEVPLIGLVKGVQAGGGSVELLTYGKSGAKSEIGGEVVPVEMPNLRNLMKKASEN